MDSELVRVNVVGFGSTNVFTVDRGVLGTVAAAHTVGAALTIRKGQYIIRDDVVFFDESSLSGVTTEFNFNTTGIPTSFNRYRFHGRVFNRRVMIETRFLMIYQKDLMDHHLCLRY